MVIPKLYTERNDFMKKIFKCSSLILVLMLLFSLKIVKADGSYIISEEKVNNLITNLPQKDSNAPDKKCLQFVSKLWKTASPLTPWPTSLYCCAYQHSL